MTDILEFGGKRYRLVEEQESPWPFEPTDGTSYYRCSVGGQFDKACGSTTPDHFLFPSIAERDKAHNHLLRVLRSLRLYENAKATGTLGDCWVVGQTGLFRVDELGREYVRMAAQAGRLFATEAEARAFAEGQE